MKVSIFFILVLTFLCVVPTVNGRIKNYKKKSLEQGNALTEKIVFILPEDSVIGSDDPTLTIEQKIIASNADSTGTFRAYFTPTSESHRIGLRSSEGVVEFCCTEENEDCDTGEIFIFASESEKDPLIELPVTFNQNIGTLKYNHTTFPSSGTYEIVYVNCPADDFGDVTITGTVHYTNPFGELSAEDYPLLWFFGIMTFVMIILTTIWAVYNVIHRDNLLSLQHFISSLLLLEFAESFVWFLMLWIANVNGKIHVGWVTSSVLISSIKRTSVGLLILLISLGYGIMNKSKIAKNRRLIILVIGFYFFVSTSFQMLNAYSREGVVSADLEVFVNFISLVLLFPAVGIPLALFWWIITCLSKTIQKLKIRKNQAKLELYNKIMILLIVAVIITSLMVVMETGISIVDSDQLWRVWWLFTAYWTVLFLGLTLGLMILLHPSKNTLWLSHAKGLPGGEEFGVEIEMDDLEEDLNINFDFDLGLDDVIEQEESKMD